VVAILQCGGDTQHVSEVIYLWGNEGVVVVWGKEDPWIIVMPQRLKMLGIFLRGIGSFVENFGLRELLLAVIFKAFRVIRIFCFKPYDNMPPFDMAVTRESVF
jgi:hypothetical protein